MQWEGLPNSQDRLKAAVEQVRRVRSEAIQALILLINFLQAVQAINCSLSEHADVHHIPACPVAPITTPTMNSTHTSQLHRLFSAIRTLLLKRVFSRHNHTGRPPSVNPCLPAVITHFQSTLTSHSHITLSHHTLTSHNQTGRLPERRPTPLSCSHSCSSPAMHSLSKSSSEYFHITITQAASHQSPSPQSSPQLSSPTLQLATAGVHDALSKGPDPLLPTPTSHALMQCVRAHCGLVSPAHAEDDSSE